MQTIRTLMALAFLALTAAAAQATPAPTAQTPVVARPAGAESASSLLQGPPVVQRVPSCSRWYCR